MTTQSHSAMVAHYVAQGYRDSHFREFLRLLHYLDGELGMRNVQAAHDLFCNAPRIRMVEAAGVAGGAAGDDGSDYMNVRADMPVPRGLPDAWLYGPSQLVEDRMELTLIEVADTCPTTMHKLAGYGMASDELEWCLLTVYEVDAKSGATTLHDPLQARALMMAHGLIGKDASRKELRVVEKEYSDWIRGGGLMCG